MAEINTRFLFTIALEIHVSSLGELPMEADVPFILTLAVSTGRSSRAGCCQAAVAGH
jgi:hypothetical protein